MAEQRERKITEDQSKLPAFAQVLTTKLYIPPARTNAIARPHLIEKLLSGVGRSGSFMLGSGRKQHRRWV
jgi:hypothetical protein